MVGLGPTKVTSIFASVNQYTRNVFCKKLKNRYHGLIREFKHGVQGKDNFYAVK